VCVLDMIPLVVSHVNRWIMMLHYYCNEYALAYSDIGYENGYGF